MFDILFEHWSHPDCPRSLDEVKNYEKKCRARGYDELADWLESWRIQLEFHIEREWDARPYADSTR